MFLLGIITFMFEYLPDDNLHVLLQMDLRERETAAAVQDLEVRQMELEAQRRRLEQVTNSLHSPFIPLLQPPLFPPLSSLFVTLFSND